MGKRLGELQTSWKGLKEAAEKRRVTLLDTRDWVVFESDATDELNFIEEERPLMQSSEVSVLCRVHLFGCVWDGDAEDGGPRCRWAIR